MEYDFIIAGGGPAGSIAAYELQKKGYRCLIFEKNPEVEEKVCGGFLSNKGRELLEMIEIPTRQIIANGAVAIRGTREFREGADLSKEYTYAKPLFGIGTYRRIFDKFLLMQALGKGAEVKFSMNVRSYERKINGYQVNGYMSKKLIWALGAQGLSCVDGIDSEAHRKMRKEQSVGVSEIVYDKMADINLSKDYVCFYFEKNSVDYFWTIPISAHTWNIGYWAQNNGRSIMEKFLKCRKQYVEPYLRQGKIIRKPRGALLGNVDLSVLLKDGDCCGDMKGTNNYNTGEGISYALESAIKLAEAF